MTYCLALSLDAGLVFGADTRTNAGVDYVTRYSKMHTYRPADDRLFVLLSAGNLATTQEVINRIGRDLDTGAPENLNNYSYLFEIASYIGRISRAVQAEHADALSRSGVSGETSFIVGGQIGQQPHGLFLVYPQGNAIAASPETPYLQIGESKYGKPMLDRILRPGLALEHGARLALVSLDATVRSNITVGMPFEIGLYRAGSLRLPSHRLVSSDDSDYVDLRNAYQSGLRDLFDRLPDLNWNNPVPEDPAGQRPS
jgi:putative proteasome-type protease